MTSSNQTDIARNYSTIRVGFDARMVYYRQAGIGQYILNLLQEMATLKDEQVDITIYQSRKENRPPAKWLGQSYPSRKLWTPPHHRFEQQALPLELGLAGPIVFHSPDFIPPFQRWRWAGWRPRRIASVITIHDLAFLRYPELLTKESARYYGQVKKATANAELVIAVSRSTARDICNELGTPPEKVRVVYEAANPLFHPLAPAELTVLGRKASQRVAARLVEAGIGWADSFILFVSTLEPRKNLPTLLKAFRAMIDELDQDVAAPKLVLAGREGWLYQDIYKLEKELRLEDNLVWLGGVSTEELLWLYNRAACLAMPSLYEGFGLPPLEALACGLPVIVADTSSLPEVVGEAGLKIAAENVKGWKEALLEVWRNRGSYKAKTLIEGPIQAARFSWRKAAAETIKIYREAAGKVSSKNKE
jgi:glycosyltransferase involved in cell wall biosynthesis